MLHFMTIVFVILKVMGYISWSWWLVFAPSIFIVAIALIAMVAYAVTAWMEYP